MKRLVELQPSDIERTPVWRYVGGNDESALLTATDRTELLADEPETFIARTEFVLANGTQFVGFCSPTDDSGLDYVQPVILTRSGPVFFWFDQPPTRELLRSQAERLGVAADAVFPVHFRCTVPVSGRFVTGVITERYEDEEQESAC